MKINLWIEVPLLFCPEIETHTQLKFRCGGNFKDQPQPIFTITLAIGDRWRYDIRMKLTVVFSKVPEIIAHTYLLQNICFCFKWNSRRILFQTYQPFWFEKYTFGFALSLILNYTPVIVLGVIENSQDLHSLSPLNGKCLSTQHTEGIIIIFETYQSFGWEQNIFHTIGSIQMLHFTPFASETESDVCVTLVTFTRDTCSPF